MEILLRRLAGSRQRVLESVCDDREARRLRALEGGEQQARRLALVAEEVTPLAGFALESEQAEQRREDVEQRRQVRASPRRHPRSADHQRHMDQRVDQVLAVREPVVALAEPLTMVGREDHDRLFQQTPVSDPVEKGPDLRVGVQHLGVVARPVESGLPLISEHLVLWNRTRPEPEDASGSLLRPSGSARAASIVRSRYPSGGV